MSNTYTAAFDGDTILKLRKYSIGVVRPDGTSSSHTFDKREIVVGTSPDADLVLDDRKVSRQHALIELEPGGYRLRDLGSKNGTYIGTLRIRDVNLEPGTTWSVGDHNLTFQLSEDELQILLSGKESYGRLKGRSKAMREVFGILSRVASTDATVLIEGESGTGKELAAQAIHDYSARRAGPFVVFDCSAVPKDLVESELFGHVKGAFTGATSNRKGAFERAIGGTLFLDELGELSLDLQPKLLRVLESHTIRPIGSGGSVECDVRVVAATNRKLNREVEAGHFRQDLYYRVAIIQVALPPLRKRPDDIPQLVELFLSQLSEAGGKGTLQVSFSTMEKLKRHRWPGNVRELKNFVERAAVLAEGDRVETKFLKLGRQQYETATTNEVDDNPLNNLEIDENMPFKDAKARLVEAFERTYWTRLLERTAGNVSKAARVAGVHRKSVEYIMKKLELSRDDLVRS